MIKLAISTVLSVVATPCEEGTEIIKLCGVATDTVSAGLVNEWFGQRCSKPQFQRLKERAEETLDEETLEAVIFPICWLMKVL